MVASQALDAASGRLLELARRLESQEGFASVTRLLSEKQPAALDGVWGSLRALVAAGLARRAGGPLVVVCSGPTEVDDLFDDLPLFTSARREWFPAWESEPGEQVLYDEVYGDRLRMLKELCSAGTACPTVIVTSIQALLQPVPDRAALAENTRSLRVGASIDQREFVAWLVEHGFHNTSAVELPGEVSVRGGVVDLFAPDWDSPVRVEWFGDEVESLRYFDVATQRSLAAAAAVDVTLLKPSDNDRGLLAAYLPPTSWTMLIEPAELEAQGRRFLERLDHPEQYHSVTAALKSLGRFPTLLVENVAAGGLETTGRLAAESVEQFSGDIKKVRDEIDAAAEGQDVVIVCRTEAEIERLDEVLSSSSAARDGRLQFLVGRLRTGFRLPAEGLVLISGDELFHRGDVVRAARRRVAGRAIDSFLDLSEGDLVVHLAHGIGRYRGIKLLEKGTQSEEHLELEFDGGTRIYVPTSKINLVQKYVGGTKRRPTLAKIGGRLWAKQKAAAEEAVSDLASDMLDLQAARETRAGIAFPPDSEWQREFDAAFPYAETPDQLSAIDAIKSDMRRSRPMDRLLCGDVGFGKTELAIRAAFKAIDAGYQVALLAPTTILVEQHFRTFARRMAEFPFTVARLSRFCSPQEERRALAGMADGSIDIVIGTHRLAQRDVAMHNLGMVIIDEEQRFGVEVKERLKALRQMVDVLTMTATPIPRTLHMSLLGLRDISNLETPPEERLAVETRVTRFDESLIRHAILRELNRGGQIFFVHNRVSDIHAVAAKLQRIVPEATLAIGHGQMPEGELERVMVDFVDHKFDVLLATTIVESGLDIPNANTIFIDEANRYGLAEMHQLRGRVGRYKHRAYCYLLIDPRKHLTPNAARRLRAIEEFSRLGAGFAIAMRDLEIRGAGNILGTQQSGHIAAVGYELYCQLLEQAVRGIRNLPPITAPESNIDLPVKAYLPRNYVPDVRLKIDFYRRLGRAASDEALADLATELTDRFGPRPPEVERLLWLAELRIAAAEWKIDTVRMEDGYVVLDYADRAKIEALAKRHNGRLRVVDGRSAYLPLRKDLTNPNSLLAVVKSLLRPA